MSLLCLYYIALQLVVNIDNNSSKTLEKIKEQDDDSEHEFDVQNDDSFWDDDDESNSKNDISQDIQCKTMCL